jgi:hypothetical protein
MTSTGWRIAMMNELEIFATTASSDAFVFLSLVCILACAACALWLTGRAPAQQMPSAALIRRAL